MLQTCPFCGGPARLVNGVQIYAICTSCGARSKGIRPKQAARSATLRVLTDEERKARYGAKQKHEYEKALQEVEKRWNKRAS